jgi:hypothetical protein
VAKPATQNYVAFRWRARGCALAAGLAFALSGCSSGDYVAPAPQAEVAIPTPSAPAQPTVTRSDLPPPPAHTGADGYPNINVDTARPVQAPVRSAEERDRLEAELLALGERQRSSTGGAPQSVVQELQELGRRSKAEALRQIESGHPAQ